MKGTIKSKDKISWLFSNGTAYKGTGFLSLYSFSDNEKLDECKRGGIAFIAGKKLGTAPMRNRAKRRLREAARQAGAPWSGVEVVLVAQRGIFKTSFADLVSSLAKFGACLSTTASASGETKTTKNNTPKERKSVSDECKQDESPDARGGEAEQQGASDYSESEELKQEKSESNKKSRTVATAILTFAVGIPQNITIVCINIYRHAISPLFPPSCRYVPTCSEYALIALRRFGFWKGLWLSVKRVGRCHPFVPGGYDPVPDKENKAITIDS